MTDRDEIAPIALDDLTVTWRTLAAVTHNYRFASPGEATLVEARRLVEVEVRSQHGDEAWAEMTGNDSTGT
jgi:hypothetical protein